jgi:iron(III) transport system substrate-binding protein
MKRRLMSLDPHTPLRDNRSMRSLIPICLVSALLLPGCAKNQPRVVLYCGQDREFAEEILADFTKQTGIRVDLRTDTEADKSVSLFEALVRESKHPRCDVFWNGEILNTIRLGQKGVLAPYASTASQPPLRKGGSEESKGGSDWDWPRSANGSWHPLAGRARILLVNANLLTEAERPKSIFELTDKKWQGKVAIAKPAFGTTATHAACLFQALGKEKAEQFYRELRANATVLPGNKDVAVAVAAGQFAVGFTDTDDAIGEVQHGRPVVIIYPDQDGIGTLFYPNTLALISGGPNPDAGRKLIDYLLRPEVEARLAKGPSAQIPVNPKVEAKPPVATPQTVKAMAVDFEKAAALWDEVQTFLRNEFAR